MEGWLTKKSTKQDVWQRKWFTYQKPILSYCSSNSSLLPINKRTINVSTATISRTRLVFLLFFLLPFFLFFSSLYYVLKQLNTGLPNIEHAFALITRGRVWVLRAETEEEVTQWIHSLDPSRMVEESLAQLRKEYDLLRTEMEQKDETISDLSASLDRGHEVVNHPQPFIFCLILIHFFFFFFGFFSN